MSETRRKWTKYQALAWEQLVVCASVCGMALFVDAAFCGSMGLTYWMGGVSENDARGAAGAGGVLSALFIAMLASIVRQNAAGELALDFDPRLRRMPVETLPLVALVFFVRTGCMLLLAGIGALQWQWMGKEFAPTPIFLMLYGYLALQTIVWTRQSLTGIEYVLGVGLLLAGLGTLYGLQLPVPSLGLLAVLLVVSFAVSLAGIALIRRDARWPLPKPAEIFDAITAFRGAPARSFRSPLEAQVWFEGQRAGWLLSISWLLLLVAGTIILRSIPEDLDYDNSHPWDFPKYRWLYPWIPYFALLLAAPIAGAVALSTGAGPTFARPLETRHLALAKLIGLFRALAATLAIAIPASVALSYYGDPAAWDLMLAAWKHAEIDLAGLAAWHLGTALLMGIAAWTLLFARTLESLALVVLSGACFFTGYVLLELRFMDDDYLGTLHFAAVPVTVAIAVTAARFRQAWRSGVLPARALDFAAAVCGAAALFALLYAGSVQFDVTFLWLGIAVGCLLVLPGASVTLHLARQRHR